MIQLASESRDVVQPYSRSAIAQGESQTLNSNRQTLLINTSTGATITITGANGKTQSFQANKTYDFGAMAPEIWGPTFTIAANGGTSNIFIN